MGRFVVTNEHEWFDNLNYIYTDLIGLSKSGESNKFDYNACYHKKYVCNGNFYGIGQDFVFVNGTLIYDGEVQSKALRRIYEDFVRLSAENVSEEDVISDVREKCIGMYVLLICVNGKKVCFVDGTSMYAVYYYFDQNRYLIANSYYNVNECVQQNCKQNVVLENGLCSTIVGNDTVFENVYRLLDNEYIQIRGGISICKLKKKHCQYNYKNANECIRDIKADAEKFAEYRKMLSKKTMLFTTGGIDSRLELSLHMACKDVVSIGYWMGNDVITNGTQLDESISRQIAKKIDAKFTIFDTACSFCDCMDGLNQEELSKYGEYACIYSHNPKWLHIPDLIFREGYDSIGFGSLNEIIRETAQIDSMWEEGFKTKDLVEKVKMRSGIFGKVINDENIVDFISSKLDCERVLADKAVSMDEAVNLFNRNRLHSNTIVDNYVNLFFYDFPVFGQKAIVDKIESIPYEWRKNGRISLALTNFWNEELAEIPYFSHHHTVLYNKQTGLIEETVKNNMEQKLRKLLRNTLVYWPLVRIGHWARGLRNPQKKRSNQILRICLSYLKDSEAMKQSGCSIRRVKDDTGFDLATLARMVAEVKMVDSVCK